MVTVLVTVLGPAAGTAGGDWTVAPVDRGGRAV